MIQLLKLKQTTYNAQIALLLAAVEKIILKLGEYQELYLLSTKVIEDGWNWMENRRPNPEEMYASTNPSLMELDSEPYYHEVYEEKPQIKTVFHSVIYLHYIVMWLSLAAERLENPGHEYRIGNDINDVDESFIISCLNYSVEASDNTSAMVQWINKNIDNLFFEHSTERLGVVGVKIPKQYFD